MGNFDISNIDLAGSSDIDGFLSSETNEWAGSKTQNSILQRIDVASSPSFNVGEIQMSDPNFAVKGVQAKPQETLGIQVTGSVGLDALFDREPNLIQPSPHRRRVASLTDISSFARVSADTLIHKSERDLWALQKDANGGFFIERLFDDNGEPLKG